MLKRRDQKIRLNQQRAQQSSSQSKNSSIRLPFRLPTPLCNITSPLMLSPTGLSKISNQLQSEGLDNSFVERSVIIYRTSVNYCDYNQPQTTCDLKTFLSALGTASIGEQLDVHLHLLDMVDATYNSSATALAESIGSNIKNFVYIFANNDHCISGAVNF